MRCANLKPDGENEMSEKSLPEAGLPTVEQIGKEYTGPGKDALRQVVLKNNAAPFDEDRDGYPAMERTRASFYKNLRAGLDLMRPKK